MPRKSQMPSKPKRKTVSFEKRVMNVVNKQAETKLKVVSLWDNEAIPSGGLYPNAVSPAVISGLQIPNVLTDLAITQGVEQEQRTGNSIQNCRLSFRGLVETVEYDATTNNNLYGYECHIVFFKNKQDISNDVSNIKTLPGNATGRVDGSLINSMYPYNKDLYTIKRVKVIRMNQYLSTTTTYNPPGQDNTFNFKRFRVDIPIKKNIKFTDTSTTPSNDWVSVGVFLINGNGDTTPGKIRAQITMDAQLRYDDF